MASRLAEQQITKLRFPEAKEKVFKEKLNDLFDMAH